jgi:hypothetical protein
LWMRCSFSSGPSCHPRRWIRSWRSSCPFEGIRGPGAPFLGRGGALQQVPHRWARRGQRSERMGVGRQNGIDSPQDGF